jgi:exonuclease VII small subunit
MSKVMTKENTEFMEWWKELNAETEKLGWGDAMLREAKDSYESGVSPKEGAIQIATVWMHNQRAKAIGPSYG